MSKNNHQSPTAGIVQTDFVREAIREKAARELGALTQRLEAFRGIERARDSLHTVSSELNTSAPALTATVADASVASKLKKLRKCVEDAHTLATEIADVLGVDAEREAVSSSRQAILDALKAAGIDTSAVMPALGGDAQ